MVPVDGSENSKRAGDFAIELSQKLGSSLLFLNVIEIPVSAYRYRRVATDLFDFLEEGSKTIVANLAEKAKTKGVPCEELLARGDPARAILTIARKKNCDCIVIGKRGLGRIQRMLQGSVSDQVTALSEVPVIVVK